MTSDVRQPLSWLTLERYALGELGAEQRAEVERALAASEGARAALAQIREPLALPPLPVVLVHAARRKAWQRKLSIGAAWVAAAAALFMLVRIEPDALPPARRGVKGGELAIEVLGERAGPSATHFAQHERFKLLVTCPPDLAGQLSAVIYQDDAIFMPLADGGPACGNRSPWPGAFTLDGDQPAQVCVRADGRAWPTSHAALEGEVVCITLRPRR